MTIHVSILEKSEILQARNSSAVKTFYDEQF